MAAQDIIRAPNHQRGIGIQKVVGGLVGRSGVVSHHPAALQPAQVAVQGLAQDIERGETRGQRRRAKCHIAILPNGDGAHIARRIVGQRAPAGTELKHIEKIPPEAVEARVAVELRDLGVDGDHVQRVDNVRRRR